jgi:ERCC4-type nuclease
MNQIKIYIDTRENKLINLINNPINNSDIKINNNFKKYVEYINNSNIKIEIKSLDIADIHIYYNNKIIYYIERKTLNDLASSIKDGRYKSQKIRLKNKLKNMNLSNDKCIYLIEYNLFNTSQNKNSSQVKYGLSLDTLKTAIINTKIRDEFSIYQTENIMESLIFIIKIIKCLIKYPPELNNNLDIDNSLDIDNKFIAGKNNLSVKKNKNLTPYITYLHQLCIIPGISLIKAKKISEKYKSFNELINEFKKNNNKELLTDIKINNRRLGTKLSNRIYNYLFY